MNLRKQRRRTIRAMRWRQPVWIAWSEAGIAGEPTGNGGFKFNIPHTSTEYMIQIRHTFDETGDHAVAMAHVADGVRFDNLPSDPRKLKARGYDQP